MDKKNIKKEVNTFLGTHRNKKFENLKFSIILVQPENMGNIGSIARIMKNFEFDDLIIFNPIETIDNILSYEAQGYAMHGKDILLNANIIEIDNQNKHIELLRNYLNNFDLVIGTTAKGKRYTNLNRLAIFLDDFSLPISEKPLKIAILFGKESRGLTNQEAEISDILLRIPASDSYSTLNLSHACGIILYEFYKKLHVITMGRGENPILLAERSDRKILYNYIKKLIKKLKIRNYRKKNALYAFKNVFERALMSKKELSMILGFFSKTYTLLKDKNLFDE
ncbi:MAG: RNA methyltransferase [Promethearchaeati archaeon]